MENADTTPSTAPSGNKKGTLGIVLVAIIIIAALAWFLAKDRVGGEGAEPEALSTSSRMAIIEEEKPEIISGLLRTKEVFSSNDALRIREYVEDIATDEELEQYKTLTDGDLLNGASLVSQLYVHATEASLMATSTVWEVVSRDDVMVGIFVPAENGYAVIQVNKVDGEWY